MELDDVRERKEQVVSFLEDYIEGLDELDEPRISGEIEDKLLDLVKRGKMIRAALTLETAERLGEYPEDLVNAAGAIELVHTGLLIHDDIIDRDLMRRGVDSIHSQYRTEGEGEVKEPDMYGKGMAICLADVSFFLAQKMIAEMEMEPEKKVEISEIFSTVFARVGMGEMMDIESAFSNEERSEEQIASTFTNKTAVYTFSLPMRIGAVHAGAENAELLGDLGERLGRMYQMKDDELGLFGDEEKTGKPVGSDLDEDKKTLHRLYFLEAVEEKEMWREKLRSEMSMEEKREVLDLMKEKGVREKVEQKIQEERKEMEDMIEGSELGPGMRSMLESLADLCVHRDR